MIISFSVGTQLIFSPQKVSKWVKKAVMNLEIRGFAKEDIKITFDKAQTTVVGSLSHPVGIRVKNLVVELNKGCEQYIGVFDRVVVPFHLSKAFKKEIDLGLIRLSGGAFTKSNTCAPDPVAETAPVVYAKTKAKRKTKKQFEQRWIRAVQRLSELELSFVKNESDNVSLEGVLIYDFKINLNEDSENFLFIERLKTLFGSGDVIARSDVDATLNFNGGETNVEGNIKAHQEFLSLNLELKEKEGSVKIKSTVYKATAEASFRGETKIEVSNLPLSIVSRFQKLKLIGLNLRKTWLNFTVDIKTNDRSLNANLTSFQTAGDFGSLLLASDQLSASWSLSKTKWSQKNPVEVKLNEISIGDIVAVKSRKKARGVFGDFGKFSAFLKLTDFKNLKGEFETKDFSVLFRSMGKSAYQKAKSATGLIDYTIDEKLSFSLNSVEFVEGGFEGLIKLNYNFNTKNLTTTFKVPHLKLNDSISKGLFNFKLTDGFEISGNGVMSKNMFMEKDEQNAKRTGKLFFKLKTKEVKFKNLEMSGFQSDCNLSVSLLNCDLLLENMEVSQKFAEITKLKSLKYKKLKSRDLSFQHNELKFSLQNNTGADFKFYWEKERGLLITPPGVGGQAVSLRDLD